jgi:hypothetical protein
MNLRLPESKGVKNRKGWQSTCFTQGAEMLILVEFGWAGLAP